MMTDFEHTDPSGNPFGADDPPRDLELAALLRRATGDVPVASVDWDRLASRISRAIPGRAAAPWWSYAARWERRLLPLALAAGLVGAFALWDSPEPAASMTLATASGDAVAEMVGGAQASDLATSYERTMLSDSGFDLTGSE
jgi:hypothetical protein